MGNSPVYPAGLIVGECPDFHSTHFNRILWVDGLGWHWRHDLYWSGKLHKRNPGRKILG